MFSKKVLLTGMFISNLAVATQITAPPENYQAASATDKLDYLWNKIVQGKYEHNPRLNLDVFNLPKLSNTDFVRQTVTHNSDEMPIYQVPLLGYVHRPKLIHAKGSVAQVEWRPTPNLYSGVFQDGGVGLIRLSLAMPPKVFGFIPTGFLPGAGLKILKDGSESVNIMIMNGLDAQDENCNFFQRDFKSLLDVPKNAGIRMLLSAFQKIAQEVQGPAATGLWLPLNHFAANDSGVVNAPHFISLVASPIAKKTPNSCDTDFRNQFDALNPGDTLFTVKAHASENDKVGVVVGELVLKSKFVASEFGDEVLFFQHKL